MIETWNVYLKKRLVMNGYEIVISLMFQNIIHDKRFLNIKSHLLEKNYDKKIING